MPLVMYGNEPPAGYDIAFNHAVSCGSAAGRLAWFSIHQTEFGVLSKVDESFLDSCLAHLTYRFIFSPCVSLEPAFYVSRRHLDYIPFDDKAKQHPFLPGLCVASWTDVLNTEIPWSPSLISCTCSAKPLPWNDRKGNLAVAN